MVAVLAVTLLWIVPRVQPTTGTLVVVASARTATTLTSTTLMLRQSDGSWVTIGSVSGQVPAAPDQAQLAATAIPVGSYDAVRLGEETDNVAVKITAGQVEPLLLGIESGRLIAGGAYAGNDDVNLGLGELAGKFVPMPPFELVDQTGKPFNLASVAGKDVVIAAFHTTCHETCPLYTALFLQLAKQAPATVALVEVTTDPATDTPSVLTRYAKEVGAGWTFATGTTQQVADFWKPFGVEIATGDSHTSTLALVDRHGYVRLVYRGVPNVGNNIPSSLISTLSAKGLQQLASHGDGWGAPDVLQALVTISRAEQSPLPAGGRAPDFTLQSTAGSTVKLAELLGRPVVINFWGTYCPPCKAELPLLDRSLAAHPEMTLLLVNEGQSPDIVSAFLERIDVKRPALLDSNLRVGRAYRVVPLPTTIFVRADGTIDRIQIGQVDERVLAAELSNLVTQ